MKQANLLFLLLLTCFLTACTAAKQAENPAVGGMKNENIIISATGQKFIALNTPVGGCKAYRPYAPGQMVVQVIYFQHPDNKFSPLKEGAICN